MYPHGIDELSHPESGDYAVGMKSYGRAPTFLLLTGYEQVRSVVAGLVGDWEAARHVELVLPETGVCSTDLAGTDGGSCCTTGTAQPLALSLVSETELFLPVLDLPSRPAPIPAKVRVAAAEALLVARPNGCCSAQEQTTCCAASDKDACCGAPSTAHGSACGCR